MSSATSSIPDSLQQALDKRKADDLYRSLQLHEGLIDFCSNDYLSFARTLRPVAPPQYPNGATGSRSISGNTVYAEELERFLAGFHHAEAGVLFNSGYDANLGLFSCIARKEDTIITDELIHASIIDGCRLSYATRYRFAHNDVADLEKKLQKAKGNVFVAVESVYSMDGDAAPLPEIAALCERYGAQLIVDEAHATGVFGTQGRGLVNHYGLEEAVFARVHTFGKAMGCHGAVVVGSELLRNYLINFARSFIFTTALPFHSLLTIRSAYERLLAEDFTNNDLHGLIRHFGDGFSTTGDVVLIDSISPVQSVIIPGNSRVKQVAAQLQVKGFDVRAIVSPSVPAGKERLRISLHLHNTREQATMLQQALNQILQA